VLELSAGSHQLKIVVMDRARNETDKLVEVNVPAGSAAGVSL
jgi:hypothetical protein